MRGKKFIISLTCKLLVHKANMSILTTTRECLTHTQKKKQKQKKKTNGLLKRLENISKVCSHLNLLLQVLLGLLV